MKKNVNCHSPMSTKQNTLRILGVSIMSMNSYFAQYESPNIVIVPTVTSIPRIQSISDTGKNNYLTVGEQFSVKDCVLPDPQSSKLVIHENVPYSGGNIGSVDASNYFSNEPCNPGVIDTQHTIRTSSSRHSTRKNLVDLTGVDHHETNVISSSTTFVGNLKSDKTYNYNNESQSIVIEQGQKYANDLNIGIEPTISTYQPHINTVDFTRSYNFPSGNMCSSKTFEEIEATLKRFDSDEFRNDSKCKILRRGVEKRRAGNDPNDSRNNKHEDDNKSREDLYQRRTEKTNKKPNAESKRGGYDTRVRFEPGSSIKRTECENIDHNDNGHITAKYSIRKLSKTADATYNIGRKFLREKAELNFFEHETLSDTQKSNLSPGALKRYLAYQRFLRNYYKTEKVKNGKACKEQDNIQVNEKRTKDKAENCAMSIVKATNRIEQTKEKPKAKAVNSSVKQMNKREEKGELREKITSVVNKKNKKEKLRVTDVVDRMQRIKETKEKLRRIIERKKNKESREKVISTCRDLKKNLVDSNKKQKIFFDEKKKEVSYKKLITSVDLKKKKESNEKPKEYLERKKNKEEANRNLPRYLERKENKEHSTDKAKRYVEPKKIKEELKLRKSQNSGRQEEREEKKPSVKSRSYNTVNTSTAKSEADVAPTTVRTVDVSKKLNNRNYIKMCDDENDLRTLLTRKRSKNPNYTESKRRKTSQRENLFITVKQNVNTKSETKVAHKSKPKAKKSKKIKLVINIECPTSADSDDSDHTVNESSSSPHPDLSFLDDFDIDGIVDSLNVGQSTTCKSNISCKDDFKDTTVCKNKFNAKQVESITHDSQFKNLHDSHMKQETLNEGCSDDAGNCNSLCHMEISQNDQKDNINSNEESIVEEKQTDSSDTQMNVKLMDNSNDEVCEVIDITEEAKDLIIILEEDSVNSDDNKGNAKENIEPLIKSDINVAETEIILLPESDKIIQNTGEGALISEDKYSKDKITASHKLKDENKLTQRSIEPTKSLTKDTITNKKIQHSSSVNNKLEATLAEIKEKDKSSGGLSKTNNYTVTKPNTQEPISVQSKQNTKCSNVAPQETVNIECSKILEHVKIDKDINSTKSNIKENLKHAKDVQSSVETESTNKQNDIIIKSKSNSDIQPSVSGKKLVKPAKHTIDMTEIKSDVKKSAISSNKQMENSPAVRNNDTSDVGTSNTQIVLNNQNSKKIPISEKPQSNKVEPASRTGQLKNVSNQKPVSNVVKNKESNNVIVPDKRDKNTERVAADQENEIESGEEISLNLNNPYITSMEQRMFEYLDGRFSITAHIHQGYFSNVYRCKDSKGETYAMKVLKRRFRNMAVCKDKMFLDLQRGIAPNTSCVLEIINNFNFSGEWCFLTEYYPKTLEQALLENGKGFHINVVQNLSRQLISAVTTLTNNQVIHTDIKPKHILLNSANGSLKLCGLDRSDYNYNIQILPSSGTASYRAPEIILGFEADYRIDVWATALVIYEMTTGIKLFPGQYNNDILYKQLCTLGPLNYDMLEQCSLLYKHFAGMKFMRQLNDKKWVFVEFRGINNKFRQKLFTTYNRDWRLSRTKKQATADLEKIKTLYKLLEQMLVMDPRHRLPITFVGAHEFIYSMCD